MTLPAPRRGRTFLVVGAAALAFLATMLAAAQQPQAQAPPAPAAKPAEAKPAAPAAAATPDKNAASYSLGVTFGNQLRGAGLTPSDVNAQRLTQGIEDALSGKAKMTPADQETIQKFINGARERTGDANHKAAAAFLADNGKKPGVMTTGSGLQYKILAPGSGDQPKATDEVTVNYRGTLLDGSQFDTNKPGPPATFQVNRVIPGFTEALQLMKPGAKFEVWIPPQLAYDMRNPPTIPPGSLLHFDVELVSVKAAPAAPPPAAAPPPKKQ
ncbi:MAG TPA: FKBP-type peptidyl-prolyl cis-trans isomerase [Steroidobacteraceae bacterium]|nr:FKBP-type peptidyl-prolyl cis-trans isomerase [Steroidobacteraceae bacterium]